MKLLGRILFAFVIGTAVWAFAGSAAVPAEPVSRPASASAQEANAQWMIEGEKRYRTNCGRCHQPPQKFPPRVMAMAVRHMRVRAMLTQDDMKYVIYYMTH
jgi:mono/diheme cytochrome c family protein